MSYTVSARVAMKRHRCDGWGCADRVIPIGAIYARTAQFMGGEGGPTVTLLCERCSQRYSLCKEAIEQRRAAAEA